MDSIADTKRTGGKRHYYLLTVLMCCGLAGASIGICGSTDGAFYGAICEELGVGRGNIAIYTTCASLATGFSLPLIVGRFKITRLMRAGVLMTVLSVLLMAFANRLWQFYLLGIIRGLGCAAFASPPLTIIMGSWFSKKRSVVIGITFSFAGAVGALFNIVFAKVISALDYHAAYILSAVVIAVITLPGAILLKESPAQLGLEPYGGKPEFAASKEGRTGKYARYKAVSLLYISVISADCFLVAVTNLTQHLHSYAVSVGRTAELGAMLSSCALVGSVVSKALIGMMCEHMGTIRSMRIIQAINIASLLVLLLVDGSDAVLMGATFMYGLMYGVTNVCMSEVIRMFYGNEQYGRAFSILALFGYSTTAITVSLIGFVYDIMGSYTAIFIGGIVCNVMGLILIAAANRAYKREVGEK